MSYEPLRDEIQSLRQQLDNHDVVVADLRDDRDTWKARAEFSFRERDKLSQQLAAQAAQIEMMREALEKIYIKDDCGCGFPCDCYSWVTMSEIAKESLAIQPDDAALKKFAARVREQCATVAGWQADGYSAAVEIRAINELPK